MTIGRYIVGALPTDAQLDYVKAIQRRLHLPDRMLNDHCIIRFECEFDGLNRSQVSALLDELIAWDELPADYQRAKGQMDLFR
jgi:hypothetical protein